MFLNLNLKLYLPTPNFSWAVKPYVWTFFKTPTAGSQTILYGALDPELKSKTGKYLSECSVSELPDKVNDADLAKFLWEETEKIIAANEAT